METKICEECIHVTHYGCDLCKECPNFKEDTELLKSAKKHDIEAFYDNAIDSTFAKAERDGLSDEYLKGRMLELCKIVMELAMEESL